MEAVYRIQRGRRGYEILYTTIADDYGSIIEINGCVPISQIEELMSGEREITPTFVGLALQLQNIYKSKL